jgi:hypothetical protein
MIDVPRVIIALATERPTDAIWNRIKMLQHEIFAAPVAVQFAFYGAEEAGQTRRPCVSTRWIEDVDDWASIISHARAACRCGCFMRTDDFLGHILREARQASVQAAIIIGDFHGNLDDAVVVAEQLGATGTRLFCLQQGHSDLTKRAFKRLAEAGRGAFSQFNPHVDMVAERLPRMIAAISHYAIGGTAAMEALDDEAANLLLEQMIAVDRLLTRKG